MTTATALRKEIHSIIDEIPEQGLTALKPYLSYLKEDYWKPVIEPASPEEAAMIDERMKDYERDPSSFVPWSEAKKLSALSS
jgi:hypothetical protein